MQDIGELLVQKRLEKNIEIEQAARETNVSSRYLHALEKDSFDVFPGEPYIVGFLRIYAEYLGLDPDEAVGLYKKRQIQETEISPTELMPKQKIFGLPSIKTVLIFVLVIAVGVGSFFGVQYVLQKKRVRDAAHAETTHSDTEKISKRSVSEYTIEQNKKLQERVFSGDRLLVLIDQKEYSIDIVGISPRLTIKTALGEHHIELGETYSIDMTNNGISDIAISVEDLHKTREEIGALIIAAVIQPEDAPSNTVVFSEDSNAPMNKTGVTLINSSSPYPVTLNVSFRGYCLFRVIADKKKQHETFFQKSDTFSIQAHNGLRVWASNGNFAKMQIAAGGKTIDIDVSRPGEVIVKDLKWIKDETTGRFKFVVLDVE